MEFPLALAVMHNDNDKCYTDSDRHAIYKIVDDNLTIWVEPVQEWRAVKEDVNDLMKYDFEESCDPSIFKFTFTEAIQKMIEGYRMKNSEYPTLVYQYSPMGEIDRYVTLNKSYNEREDHAGFTAEEVEAKWGIEEAFFF